MVVLAFYFNNVCDCDCHVIIGFNRPFNLHPIFSFLKMVDFLVNVYKVENVNVGRQVVKKRQNLVNVVCEWPQILGIYEPLFSYEP